MPPTVAARVARPGVIVAVAAAAARGLINIPHALPAPTPGIATAPPVLEQAHRLAAKRPAHQTRPGRRSGPHGGAMPRIQTDT